MIQRRPKGGGVSRFFCSLGLLCAALLFAAGARAQVGATSSISGQVLDASKAVVVNATISLTDPTTKAVRTTTSNEVGRYSFSDVLPGTYDLSVAKDGFETQRASKVDVLVGVPLTLDFALKVGSASTTIEVTASAGAQLQTNNATTGDTLAGNTLLLAPAFARDASALVVFQPGVTGGGNVAGQENDQNTFMVDGANNSQDMDGGNNVYLTGFGGPTNGTVPTPAESVEEFKVNTSGQTADFYSSGGAQVQLVTKKGTDNWHGSAYDFYQANWLDANDFADNQTASKLVVEHQNRFGAAFGGRLTPKFWGGKTYFYVNYEGRRFPQANFQTRTTPTALMRAGVLQFKDDTGNPIFYNFNPGAVTVGATTYPGSGTSLDPRGIGINTLLQTMWNKFMPLPNNLLSGDHVNTQGFKGPVDLPTSDDTGVVRIDHDLGAKWHLFGSYRIYKLRTPSTVQTDIGGFAPGDTFGTFAATASRPSEPSLMVVGLTGQLTTNLTNDLHINYTRNDWQWGDVSGNSNLNQIPGVPAAVEPGGESSNALIPMNVNTQSTRQRIWDGHDYYYRDDLTLLHGNHFFSFGGQVNRNWLFHTRNDNGSSTDVNTTYLIGNSSINWANNLPTLCPNVPNDATANCLPQGQIGNYELEASEILGIVDLPQVLLTRAGPNLAIQPAGTSAFDQSTIMTYDMYFSDSWHIKSNLTLTYGLNYGIQMPPHEAQGKQVMLVDSNGTAISAVDYLGARFNAAVNGNFSAPTYTPELGYELVNNVGGGRKYPYDPFYGGFGPRLSVAWSPNFSGGWKEKLFGQNSTVLRGGYSRVFTRENGVDLVLVPLLGVGLFQGNSCQDPTTALICAGPNGATPTTAFRLGTDGLVAPLPAPTATLPQPVYPGVGGQSQATATLMLDSKLRPGATDQFNLSLQRSFAKGFMMEAGYIGIVANHLYMGVDLDQIPWMSTLAGQSFAQAYANIEEDVLKGNTVQPQPFIEAAMTGSSACTGFTSCTAAVMATKASGGLGQVSNFQLQNVYNIWQTISSHFNTTTFPPFNPATGFGGTDTSINGQAQAEYMASSLGISNYNAGYVSLKKQTSFGLTFNANLTYSHELGSVNGGQAFNGESPTNSWDPAHSDYTTGGFDHRFIFNLLGSYDLPFGKGEHGFLGHLIGGWSIAPILTWQTGNPILVEDGSCQEAGQAPAESNCSQAVMVNGANTLNNVPHGNFRNVVATNIGTNGNLANGGYGFNYFQNPDSAFGSFRPFILGIDQNGAGNGGPVTNPNNWNLNFTVAKDTMIREGMGITFTASFFNALNHTNWSACNGGWSLQDTIDFGTMCPDDSPRVIEMGLRFHF